MYLLVIADEHDCMIKDIDRYEFLDFTSNMDSSSLGYVHPDILKIRAKYVKIGIGKIAGKDFYCEEHAQFSKNLLLILPDKFKIFFPIVVLRLLKILLPYLDNHNMQFSHIACRIITRNNHWNSCIARISTIL